VITRIAFLLLYPWSQLSISATGAVCSGIEELNTANMSNTGKHTETASATNGTTNPTTDVVIIGAGLAGLTAARDILAAGLSCIILEARDRVGGKTWSQPLSDNKGVVDLGAAWINDVNQTQVYALAKKYNAEFIEQNTTGDCAIQDAEGEIGRFAYGELPPVSFLLLSLRG